jgi:hypothetical protein
MVSEAKMQDSNKAEVVGTEWLLKELTTAGTKISGNVS